MSSKGLGWVYFVGMPKLRLMKIGYATNTARRLGHLQTASPFELRIEEQFVGTKTDERALQQFFRPYRYNREWFRDRNDAIYEFITEIGEWRFDAWLEHEAKHPSGRPLFRDEDPLPGLAQFPISKFVREVCSSATILEHLADA